MWPFKRKNKPIETQNTGVRCPHCGSSNTRLVQNHGADSPNYVKVWRGERSLTYRCADCGRDFYSAAPPSGITDEILDDDRLVDDEEALREAEEDLKRQIEEEKKRKYL